MLIGFLIAFYSGLPGLLIAEILRKKNIGLYQLIMNFGVCYHIRPKRDLIYRQKGGFKY